MPRPAQPPGGRAVAGAGLPGRLLRLFAGLAGFGVSVALLVRADLGLDPWDVLHQGLAERLGVPIGGVVIAVSGVVLLLWWPLRQRPGFGTVCNAVVVGLVVDATLAAVPSWRRRSTSALASVPARGTGS